MHKNIPVANISIDTSGLHKVTPVLCNQAHLPLYCRNNLNNIGKWWHDRAVPKTRSGANLALKKLGLNSVNSLLIKNLALSLNDCYWIKPFDSNLRWEEVSLFRNNFIDIFGELTFDKDAHIDLRNKTLFKCATSQGELKKKWCIAVDKNGTKTQFLVKGNWGDSYQQSLNEVLASEIHRLQNKVNYVQYGLTEVDVDKHNKGIGCYSFNFCSESIESISAWEVLQYADVKNNESWYKKLVDTCVNLGMNREYVENFLGYEILTDFLITNTDRHMNNISILRNPDTLQIYGFAPIYDSGNSMFFRDRVIGGKDIFYKDTCSFIKKETGLLKLVHDRSVVDLNKLPSEAWIRNLYLKDVDERHWRIDGMIESFKKKADRIYKMQTNV